MSTERDDFAAFVETEADRIAGLIDAGKPAKEVDESMTGHGHSGSSAAYAWAVGCARAQNAEGAQIFRDYWNDKWGATDVPPGQIVDPSVMTIET